MNLVEMIIEDLSSIINELSSINFSRIITSSIIPPFNLDNISTIVQTIFFKSSPFEDLSRLQEFIQITAHETTILTKCFFEFKIIQYEQVVKNYDQQLRLYIEALITCSQLIEEVKQKNTNSYINDFLNNIEPFTQGMLLIWNYVLSFVEIKSSVKLLQYYCFGDLGHISTFTRIYGSSPTPSNLIVVFDIIKK